MKDKFSLWMIPVLLMLTVVLSPFSKVPERVVMLLRLSLKLAKEKLERRQSRPLFHLIPKE